MHTFNYESMTKTLLTPEIAQMLSALHEHKGRQNLTTASQLI